MRISHSLELGFQSLRRRTPSLIEKAAPYLLMLAATCIPLIIYFQSPGIRSGDDALWHVTYTYDLYTGMKNGFFGITPSHSIMGTLGYDIFLFYGPFPHYTAAFLAYIFSWMGGRNHRLPQTRHHGEYLCLGSIHL